VTIEDGIGILIPQIWCYGFGSSGIFVLTSLDCNICVTEHSSPLQVKICNFGKSQVSSFVLWFTIDQCRGIDYWKISLIQDHPSNCLKGLLVNPHTIAWEQLQLFVGTNAHLSAWY
jgi:hypothetical protein